MSDVMCPYCMKYHEMGKFCDMQALWNEQTKLLAKYLKTAPLQSKIDSPLAENAEIKKEQDELRKELSSRPTEWAYEQVCKANEDKRVKLTSKDEEIAELKLALADRSEKYKLFMDKGLDQLHAENKRLREALEGLMDDFDNRDRIAYINAEKALQKPKVGGE